MRSKHGGDIIRGNVFQYTKKDFLPKVKSLQIFFIYYDKINAENRADFARARATEQPNLLIVNDCEGRLDDRVKYVRLYAVYLEKPPRSGSIIYKYPSPSTGVIVLGEVGFVRLSFMN